MKGQGKLNSHIIFESMLMLLTNHATRLEVIRYVRYGFLLLPYSNFVRLQKCLDLEDRVIHEDLVVHEVH